MIYIDEHIDDFDLQEALAAVSPQRREYALRYRHERDQRLCVSAYRLLQEALLKAYGIDELPQFIYNQQNKPLLDGHPEIHFSLSHCREAVACAIGDEPVGIDIETMDHYSEEVAIRVMNEQEMRQIMESPDPAREFTRLWTMKESLYKLTGDDHGGEIAHMLDDTSSVRFKTLDYPLFTVSECRYLHTNQLDL